MAVYSSQNWDYNAMNTEKSHINTQAGVMDDISRRMESIVGVLDRALVGDSLVAFKSSHQSVNGQYLRLKEMLNGMSDSLGKAVSRMQQDDKANADFIKRQFGQFM